MQMQMHLDECIACIFRLSLLQPAYVVHTNRPHQQHHAVDQDIDLVDYYPQSSFNASKGRSGNQNISESRITHESASVNKWWGRGDTAPPKVPLRPYWPYLYLPSYYLTLYVDSWVGTRQVFLHRRIGLRENLTLIVGIWRELGAKCDLSSPSA